jgi:hypothetical protein
LHFACSLKVIAAVGIAKSSLWRDLCAAVATFSPWHRLIAPERRLESLNGLLAVNFLQERRLVGEIAWNHRAMHTFLT